MIPYDPLWPLMTPYGPDDPYGPYDPYGLPWPLWPL